MSRSVTLCVLAAACHSHGGGDYRLLAAHRDTTGDITGIVWDRDTGNAITGAEVRAQLGSGATQVARSTPGGLYDLRNLAPGHYVLHGTFAGQTVVDPDVEVKVGDVTLTKLPFHLAHPPADTTKEIVVDWGSLSEITRYRPPGLAATTSQIEGFVIDGPTRHAVAGAVINALGPTGPTAMSDQVISDDRGRFRFTGVLPGTYVISAYYSVTKRGQIEVRRSDIAVAGGEAVVVPLVVELAQ